MASDRDTLAALIRSEYVTRPEGARPAPRVLAGAILSAGWRPPAEVIETMADLDALPVGAVVRTEEGRVAVKIYHRREPDPRGSQSEWDLADEEDATAASDELDDLPALLLWSPTEKAGTE